MVYTGTSTFLESCGPTVTLPMTLSARSHPFCCLDGTVNLQVRLPCYHQPMIVADYRQELIESLSTARQTALQSICRSQKKYKKQYDRKSDSYKYQVGEWVLIRYPSEETRRFR